MWENNIHTAYRDCLSTIQACEHSDGLGQVGMLLNQMISMNCMTWEEVLMLPNHIAAELELMFYYDV